MNSVDIWNRMVALKNPKVRDIETILVCHLKNVYEHAPNFLCAEPNLLLRLPIGTSYHADSHVISMSLILKASYLSPLTLVKPSDLRALSIFGILLEGSAAETVKALEHSQISSLDLVTENRRWVIYYGKAIAFEFAAYPPLESPDPQRSEMVAISYYFSVPYTGTRSPVIEARI